MRLWGLRLDAAWPSGWEIAVAVGQRFWPVILIIVLAVVTVAIIRRRKK